MPHRLPTHRLRTSALAIVIGVPTLPGAHACWDEAAARYQLDSRLLHAIARTESSLNARAVNLNRNGSRDIGLMQINSAWLPTLSRHRIHERYLFEPCTNLHVGAWILAREIRRHGPTWTAVGAYHSPTRAHRLRYVTRVQHHYRLTQLTSQQTAPQTSPQSSLTTSLQTTPRAPP